jgi:hypothetical protein
MAIKEISETYTFRTETGLQGGFYIKRYIRDRVWIRWSQSLVGRIGFVLFDQSGKELYRGSRPINYSHMVNLTLRIEKYLTEYIPIEVTIIHYLDGRDKDLVLEVRLLTNSKNSCFSYSTINPTYGSWSR